MTKTHNPFGYTQVNLDEWDLVGFFYQGPSEEEHAAYSMDYSRTLEVLGAGGFDWDDVKFHDNGGCASCGTIFSHGVVVTDGTAVIAIGGICANKWGSEQGRVIAAAKEIVKRATFKSAGIIFAEKHNLVEALETDQHIVKDIRGRLYQYGSITPKQIALVEKIARETLERKAAFAARDALLADAPALVEGRSTHTGTVVSTKYVEGWGYNESILKMLVELENGNRIWGTVPAAIDNVERGDEIQFDATINPSDDDEHFGFFKRPTKAKITSEKETTDVVVCGWCEELVKCSCYDKEVTT